MLITVRNDAGDLSINCAEMADVDIPNMIAAAVRAAFDAGLSSEGENFDIAVEF